MEADVYQECVKFRLEAMANAKTALEEVFRKKFEEKFAKALSQEPEAPPQEPIFERKPY